MQVCLLRHGRSLADDERKIEGRYDSPLTEIGRRQAEALADRWATEGRQFNLIAASTLRRAHETACIVGKRLEVVVETDPVWMELDNGPLAGMPRELAVRKYPLADFINPFDPLAGVCESPWELHSRAMMAIAGIVGRGEGSYLVVSHGGILNAVARVICGTQPPVNRSELRFRFRDTGHLDLHYNHGSHAWFVERFEPGVTVIEG